MWNKRPVVIIFAAMILFSAIGYFALSPSREEGLIDHKTITGIRDSAQYTIALFTDSGVNVKDKAFNEEFSTSHIIDEELSHRLDSYYDEVNYLASVRTEDGTIAYYTSREDFNKVNTGDTIRFRILKSKTTIKIIEIVR